MLLCRRKEILTVVKPQGTGTTEETVSFEEQMRRERLRDRSTGVTEYYWYATDGATEHLGG